MIAWIFSPEVKNSNMKKVLNLESFLNKKSAGSEFSLPVLFYMSVFALVEFLERRMV